MNTLTLGKHANIFVTRYKVATPSVVVALFESPEESTSAASKDLDKQGWGNTA